MNRLIFILCMVPWFPVQAQLLSWANLQPGVDHAHQTCMAVDANSNVYITGWFQNTVDFDPDTGSFTLTSVSNSEDIFLAKYDANGKFKWVLGFGGTYDEQGISLAIDHSGHILMAALFRSICDFDAGGNVANVTGNGQNDFAIAKYDSSGNFTWVKSFGSVTNESKIQIDVDALNNIYAAGAFSGTIDFDPSPANSFNITSAFGDDIFISKLDSNGNFIWAKSIEGNSSAEEANAIDVDSYGNVYFTGRADGGTGVDYDPGPGVYNLAYALWDPFVEKLDSAGNFLWVRSFLVPGLQTGIGQALHCDASGNVLSAGQFFGSIDLNPDTSITDNIISAGNWDTYISKLDNAGSLIWGKSIGGPDNDYANALTADAKNNIYLTGQFSNFCDFNPDTSLFYNIQSNGFNSPDMYDLKLDSGGNFVWAFNIGGIYTDEGNSIAVDKSNNIFINGRFGGTVDFDPDTTLTYNLTSSSYNNLFLMKLGQCITQATAINQTACDSFAFNGVTYFSSGTYLHVFNDMNGCDSVVTLNLTIPDIDTTLTHNGIVLQSNFQQASTLYQWIDCNTGTIIPSQTNILFAPTISGNYAVVISYNGCTDTSQCMYVSVTGIDENVSHKLFYIISNPTTGAFQILFSHTYKNCEVEVYDSMGKLILYNTLATENNIDLKYMPHGLYLIKVTVDGKTEAVKIIK